MHGERKLLCHPVCGARAIAKQWVPAFTLIPTLSTPPPPPPMQEARLAREEASQLRVQLMKAEGQRLDAVVTLKKADTTNQVGVA